MSEEQFWDSTPRKVFALIDIYRKVNEQSDTSSNSSMSNDRVEYL